MEEIARAVESVATARISMTSVHMLAGRETETRGVGVVDFARALMLITLGEDGVEHLVTGTAVLRPLADEERRRTGKTWRLQAENCPYWSGSPAETVAALRLGIAEPAGCTAEIVDGERLRHYSFAIVARGGHDDPVIGRLYEHLRFHRTKRVTLDIWLSDEGAPRHMIEQWEAARWAPNGTCVRMLSETWDFGVTVDIIAPADDQIDRPRRIPCQR